MNATSLTTRASSDAPSFFDSVFFFVLGASFHVLATPEIGGVSVRLGVSDLLLGAALLLLAWRYIGPSKIPPPAAPLASYVWHAGMLTLFVWAYLRVGIYGDSSAQWARIKVVGFVVLFAYFVLGSWIASTSTRSGLLVARGFVAGAWVTAAVGVVEYGAAHYLVYPIPWYPRPAALAGNPNAFGIMLGAALALELGSRATRPLFSTRVATLGASVILVAIFVSASRSAYVGLLAGLIGLTLFTSFRPWRELVRPTIAAVALFVMLFVIPPTLPGAYRAVVDSVRNTGPTGSTATAPTSSNGIVGGSGGAPAPSPAAAAAPPKETYAVSREMVDLGVRDRLDLSRQSLMMWWDQPLFGAGLGSFWRKQQGRDVPFAYVNHNTALWLASEVGLVGLLTFFGGALMAIVMLVRHGKGTVLAEGVVGMMLVALGASVGTEVMYQRYTWCFCGLAIGLVAQARRVGHAPSEHDLVSAKQADQTGSSVATSQVS